MYFGAIFLNLQKYFYNFFMKKNIVTDKLTSLYVYSLNYVYQFLVNLCLMFC